MTTNQLWVPKCGKKKILTFFPQQTQSTLLCIITEGHSSHSHIPLFLELCLVEHFECPKELKCLHFSSVRLEED